MTRDNSKNEYSRGRSLGNPKENLRNQNIKGTTSTNPTTRKKTNRKKRHLIHHKRAATCTSSILAFVSASIIPNGLPAWSLCFEYARKIDGNLDDGEREEGGFLDLLREKVVLAKQNPQAAAQSFRARGRTRGRERERELLAQIPQIGVNRRTEN